MQDLAKALEKWADRVFLLGVMAGAAWLGTRHDATARVEEVSQKLENVVSQINQGFQQMQSRVGALETANKSAAKTK